MRWKLGLIAGALLFSAVTVRAADASARQAAARDLVGSNPGTLLLESAGRITRVYGAPFGIGGSPEEAAAGFVQSHSAIFGVAPEDLTPGNHFNDQLTQTLGYDPVTDTYRLMLIYYRQHKGGIPVYQADLRLLVRYEPGYPLVWAGSSLRDLGDFVLPQIPQDQTADFGYAAALAVASDLVNFTLAEYVIWAGVEDEQVTPRLALKFVADNDPATSPEHHKWLFLVNALTGEILHQENLIIRAAISGNVSGQATTGWAAEACGPEASTPLKYARVDRGAAFAYADGNGNFTIDDGGSSPVTLTSYVRGQYFVVLNAAGAEDFLTQSVSAPGPANFVHNSADTAELYKAEVNAYVQANVVRDYLLAYNPSYPTISTQTNFPANVMVAGTCNAYYDGSSINFYPAGGGCNDTAFATVIHHEYGHHIVQCAGSGQNEYGEGFGDCMGVIVTDQSLLAIGFQSCSAGLRDANNTCKYQVSPSCSDCGSEIHDCGQLLSGCVWSVRTNLLATNPSTYRDIISNLVINSVLLHSGSGINAQVAIDFLTVDDNIYGDGNINNGTPHHSEICNGFSAHSIPCPALSLLAFSYPNGQPVSVNPAGGTTLRVTVQGVSGTPQPGTGVLYYKLGAGSWTNTPMQVVSDNVYDAVFPAAPCGTAIQYYVSAQTTTSTTVYDPSNAPTGYYVTSSAYGAVQVLNDAFETDLGWTVGDTGDTATTGVWTRNVPQATIAEPGSDHTPGAGTMCWVTDYRSQAGNDGAYDVDGGKTTLKSPTLDLSSYGDAKIGYWRWYSNSQGGGPNADTFRVDISNNNGTSWVNVETVGPTGEVDGGWFYHEFVVSSFVSLTNQIKLRFIAEDAATPSLIEAAVDDFLATGLDCTVPFATGDMNCDGAVNNQDIDGFVLALFDPAGYAAQYPNCNILNGDFTTDGLVNNQDIDGFVAALFGS